jgi:hypothetical protein
MTTMSEAYRYNDAAGHEKAVEAMRASDRCVFIVAEWLHGLGYSISVPAVTFAKRHEDWKHHADKGDLFIRHLKRPRGYAWHKVEVKGLTYDFTGAQDWPFRESMGFHSDQYIVCTKHQWDRADPKPVAYISLSRDREYAAILTTADTSSWRVEDVTHTRQDGRTQAKYITHPDQSSYVRVGARLPEGWEQGE